MEGAQSSWQRDYNWNMFEILGNMNKRRKNRYRENVLSTLSTKLYTHSVRSILDILITMTTLSFILPVLFSCSTDVPAMEAETHVRLKSSWSYRNEDISSIDILTFNDDALQRMDSYTRIPMNRSDRIRIRSQTGSKLIFACANCQWDRMQWAAAGSYSSLSRIYAELQDEIPGRMLLCGEERAYAGSTEEAEVELAPIASQVILQSIRCDFSETSYPQARISDCSVYLTNVNSRCSVLADDPVMPVHIINHAGADESDIAGFADPGIVFRRLDSGIGSSEKRPDIRLLCYPNAGETDGPGSPFTRLVIEGEIESERYWWPISINRHEGAHEPGIYRNRCYIYDIVIKRKGTKDPDLPICSHHAEAVLSTLPWNGMEEYTVGF